MTVTVGVTNVRAAVPTPLGVGLGIHVLQDDHTVAIGVVLHLVIVVRHVGMRRTRTKSQTPSLGLSRQK